MGPVKTISLTLMLLTAACQPLWAQYAQAEAVPEEYRAGWEDFDAKTCKKWLTILASDKFAGRSTGTKGYQLAADFMAKRFKEFGLKPIGDNGSYFQHVPFARLETQPKKCWIEVVGQKPSRLKASAGIAFGHRMSGRPALGSGKLEGEVLFIRARGKNAALKDPSIMDGKILLINSRNDLKAPLRRQVRESKALAVLIVKNSVSKAHLRSQSGLKMAADLHISAFIQEKAAKKLAKSLGLDPKLMTKPKEDMIEFQVLERRIKLNAAAKRKDILVPNVVGLIEGSDPDLSKEVVILGSHLDHIGKTGKKINNGADDDGSGSTAILAIARAMSRTPTKPKRSIMFIAVCGEEMGLLGSRYYTENPILPIKATVCELQMDMIGRNEEDKSRGERARDNIDTLHLVGSKRLSMELHEFIMDCNRHLKFKFEYDEEDVYTRSDHYNFAKKGIPVAFVFSGFHPDYHKPTDTVDKINFKKLVSVARLYYLVALKVANQTKRIVVDSGPLATPGVGN
ncbi:MAG: M20/M25/M40 family metallo-hydrolase [Planctomycetota bacterium]